MWTLGGEGVSINSWCSSRLIETALLKKSWSTWNSHVRDAGFCYRLWTTTINILNSWPEKRLTGQEEHAKVTHQPPPFFFLRKSNFFDCQVFLASCWVLACKHRLAIALTSDIHSMETCLSRTIFPLTCPNVCFKIAFNLTTTRQANPCLVSDASLRTNLQKALCLYWFSPVFMSLSVLTVFQNVPTSDRCASAAGEYRLSREDGAHYQGVPHPRQPLGSVLQPVSRTHGNLHTGTPHKHRMWLVLGIRPLPAMHSFGECGGKVSSGKHSVFEGASQFKAARLCR